jgi:hypothetical protein
MPNFEVQCAFQCVKCRKVNVKIVVVAATDENEARELALESTTCKRCGRHISNKQTFTAKMKEVE